MGKGSINKVLLIGNLGADPELKNLPDGSSLATLRLATTESWVDKNNLPERMEKTEWHRVVFFGRSAEVLHEHARKGAKLYVEGSLQTRKWQDKDGNDRYFTEVRGREFTFLGARGEGGGGGDRHQAAQSGPGGDALSELDDVPF